MTAEEDFARLERQVLGVARVRSFRSAVDTIRTMLAREDPRVRARLIALVAPQVGRDLAAAISKAFDVGIVAALATIGEGAPDDLPSRPPAYLIAFAKTAEKEIAADVAKARALARAGDDAGAFAAASSARTRLERAVTTLVNGAGNAGALAVADEADVPVVWVSESNACVTCLAYSGIIAEPGKKFPAGKSYGKRSTVASPLDHPPAHPNCRCTIEPLNSPEYAEALRREADRSVLRGFSLSSESMATRIDAADRLLKVVETLPPGVDAGNRRHAPKSVIDYARRAVKAGEFPNRGRG